MSEIKIFLKQGREKSVRNRHPWIFSGAIARVEGQPGDGAVVTVYDYKENFLARGIYNRQSQIQVRVFTWQWDEQITLDFWRRRLGRAVMGRQALAQSTDSNAYRLVHSEADGLSGLIVDRYGDWLVVQFLSLAVDKHRVDILQSLTELLAPRGIYERSDGEGRGKEGLPTQTGLIQGEMPPENLEILEHGLRFGVDVKAGHKTGFYLDQRDNRYKALPYLAQAEVLNVFAYTGGFSVYAAQAQAKHIVNVDTSAPMLQAAQQNMQLNGFADQSVEYVTADAFDLLRLYQQSGRQFDVVILDPPKFAYNKQQVEKATRGYKDINMQAMRLLKPGGYLLTFSCSGMVSADLFQKVVFGASVDAAREVQIIERLTQSSDHPILLTCPESDYLKGLVLRIVN